MRSVDTNILARYVMQDNLHQAELAAQILADPSFVSDTVLLETAWLLSSRYRMARTDVADTLIDLLALPGLHVGDASMIRWAIDRFAAGADFADMMHIVTSCFADSFLTFDTTLAKRAGPGAPIPIETPA